MGGKNNIYPVHSKREAMSKTYFNDASFVFAGGFGVVLLYFFFFTPLLLSLFSPETWFLTWGEDSILSFFTAAGFCSL